MPTGTGTLVGTGTVVKGTNFIVRDPPVKFLFLIIKNLFLELDLPKSLDLDPESINLDPQH
jgi:hypothetical protein